MSKRLGGELEAPGVGIRRISAAGHLVKRCGGAGASRFQDSSLGVLSGGEENLIKRVDALELIVGNQHAINFKPIQRVALLQSQADANLPDAHGVLFRVLLQHRAMQPVRRARGVGVRCGDGKHGSRADYEGEQDESAKVPSPAGGYCSCR